MKFSNILLIILLFCLNIVFNNTNAQTNEIDSLKQVLKAKNISDTIRINTINLISARLFRIDNQEALNYLNEASKEAKKINYAEGVIESTRLLGIYHYYHSNFDTARALLTESMRYYEKNNKQRSVAKCLVNIGNVNLVDNKLDSALRYYEKALVLNKKNNNQKGIATCYGNIGLIYKQQNRFPEAIEYYKRSLKFYQEEGNLEVIASLNNKIGLIYLGLKRIDDALEYNKRSIKLSKESGDRLGESLYLNNLGVIYFKQGKNDSALFYYKQSLKLKLELNNTFNLSSMYVNIGKIMYKKGDTKKAIEYYFKAYDIEKKLKNKHLLCKINNTIGEAYYKKGYYEKSKYYIKKSVELAEEIDYTKLLAANRLLLSRVYNKTKDYKKAYINYKVYTELTNIINKKHNIEKIAEIELEYKYKEKEKISKLEQEKKRAILSKEIENQKKTKNIFIILFLVATLAVIQFIRLLITRIKTNKILQLKNEEIKKQSLELKKKSTELTQQKLLLEETVKQRTSELQIEKDKAEESDNLKTAILNNISHEYRTPMNGIIGFTSLLVKPNISEVEKKSYSKIIINSCNQLLNVVTDTVDISKINGKQCKIVNSNTNIQTIISSIIEALKDVAEEKGLIFETNIDINKNDIEVETDKNKLERILWHLIHNAIKFTKTGKISINVSINNGFINFKIIDTGKGIPQNMYSSIFEPFTQISTSTIETVKGNGFGLPITKGYIELLGGEIKVDSKIGKGTTVYFTIPFKRIDNPITESNNTNRKETHQKTILLAEDDEINAYLIDRIFSKYDINLITATNGKEAVNIFKEQHDKIDMVLLDLRMPIMNGFEAISIIRKINSEIPVIAYTAYCSKPEIAEIIKAGFDDYISKPIEKEKLLKIVFAEY